MTWTDRILIIIVAYCEARVWWTWVLGKKWWLI